jgi:hypothetical protein
VNITDYLIDPANKDWSQLLAPFVPPLPARFNVWLVNRLGDVFVVDETGSVRCLDAGAGTCNVVAQSREHFAQLLDAPGNADAWLRTALVDACRRRGMHLGALECYGFRIPPTLGGAYEAANLVPTHLAIHYSYQAYVCKQQDVYWIPPG